jgi:hypothetical protein
MWDERRGDNQTTIFRRFLMGSNRMKLTGFALRFASPRKIKAATQDTDAEYLEWESAGYTFVKSPAHLVIVRAGAMGGDVLDIHGGWEYLLPAHMEAEWREIKSLAESFRRHGID